jgi:glutaredoxin 3
MEVTIYTNTGCSACHLAMDFMTRNGVSFTEKSLADDPAARDELLAMGYRAVPVIKVGAETMVGFSVPKLRKLLSL